MAEVHQTLSSCFAEAEEKRQMVESAYDTRDISFQNTLNTTIKRYERCLEIADEVSLFSPNETLEDVSSGDIQYFPIRYYLAELLMRLTNRDRKETLNHAREQLEQFLKLVDSYSILSREDLRTLEKYQDDPNAFSVASTTDAASRRQTKISRFKEEKALKEKLDHLRKNPSILQNDDTALRELNLTRVNLCIHQTFQSLESVAQELQILSLAPQDPSRESQRPTDPRSREGNPTERYSDRLDAPLASLLANGKAGPILNQDGRPMRPFTLLDNRQRLQQQVFRPDHNLPTMTIDEYLEEERRRGGIIEGGGPQSMSQPEPNEDDLEKADEDTMKARQWDAFKEDNPKGAGNTMNMG